MASNDQPISPKDLEVLSDSVFEGVNEFDKLTPAAQSVLSQYWGQMGMTADPMSAEGQSQLNELAGLRADQIEAENSIFNTPIFKPIEWVGSKLYWLYSKTASPALSGGAMAMHNIIWGRPGEFGQDGDSYWERELDFFKDTWDAAHNVSPGQAVWMLGMSNDELKQKGISPSQMATDKALKAKGEYINPNDPDDRIGVMTRAEEYFGNGPSKYVTGVTDLAVSWWADPLVFTGKVIGRTRDITYVKNVNDELGRISKARGQQYDNFDFLARRSDFQSMVNLVEETKRVHPERAAKLISEMPTFRLSAGGETLARYLTKTKNADETSDLIRISMGDEMAKDTLLLRNLQLGNAVRRLTDRNAVHGSYYDGLDDATKASPRGQKIKKALDDQSAFVARLEKEKAWFSTWDELSDSIDAMRFNRVTTPAGSAYRAEPFKTIEGGPIQATMRLAYNAVGVPIYVVKSAGNLKPSHYIDFHAEDSWREVDASLRDARGLSREAREGLVADYIKTPVAGRAAKLQSIERSVVRDMVERHNLKNPADQVTHETAMDMYTAVAERRMGMQQAATKRTYGTAEVPHPTAVGANVRAASVTDEGGITVPHPLFETQLANTHVMMDMKLFEKTLKLHGASWSKTRAFKGELWYKTTEAADTLNTIWKFAQLARLGYGPRALADDFLGQAARFGMFNTLTRTMSGLGTTAERAFRHMTQKEGVASARLNTARLDLELEDMAAIQDDLISQINNANLAGDTAKVDSLMNEMKLLDDWIAKNRSERFDAESAAGYAQSMQAHQIGRNVYAPAFLGPEGNMFRDLASSQNSIRNFLSSSADFQLKRMRQGQWDNIDASQGAKVHLEAWTRIINRQIASSTAGRHALAGKSEEWLVNWMRSTAEGKDYARAVKPQNRSYQDQAHRIKAEVDLMMDPAIAGMNDLRLAALNGELTSKMLDEAVPQAYRPMVNAERWGYAEGTGALAQLIDKSMTAFYKYINQLPADRLLRNPLFNQQYGAHLHHMQSVRQAQGVNRISIREMETMQTQARKLALRDVKRFTFTMDHETKMAYYMRFFGAFFGAQAESWARWSRIIADKPQSLAHIAQVYGAPARAGIVTDMESNPVDGMGYSTNTVTGERKLVEYTDRRMVLQIPEYLGGKQFKKFFGLSEDYDFTMPMSTLELILNTGDGALPVGAGPIVQIAANNIPGTEFDANGTPQLADMYKKLGILPFGPQGNNWDFINPNTGSKLGDAINEFSGTKQRYMANGMQIEHFKFREGLRENEVTWEELEDRSSRFAWFKFAVAGLSPASLGVQDKYQFFRDEYKKMLDVDPEGADEAFQAKYGDSFQSFSMSMSRNNSGLKATVESIQVSKEFADLISEVGPEYASVIVGHEGEGKFSQGAYYYQSSHSVDPASNTPDRTKLGAREAWEQAQASAGWSAFHKERDQIYSELFDAGFESINDPGAEDYKARLDSVVYTLTNAVNLDGTKNKLYNAAFSEAFNTIDKSKYDRNAVELEKVVSNPAMWAKATDGQGNFGIRSDIATLKSYLINRRQMQLALAQREESGMSGDILAQDNYDLRDSWENYVTSLLQSDTRFSWIHARFFARDMGFAMNSLDPRVQAAISENTDMLSGQPLGSVGLDEEGLSGGVYG